MSLFTDLIPKKKPKAKGLYIPNFLRKARTGAKITDERVNRTNTDLTTLRLGASTEENVREFIKESPDASHATELIMRFSITDRFTLVAKDLETDTINPEVTRQIQTFAARINKLPVAYDGFRPQSAINAISESLVKQLLGNGACCAELVLDKTLLPSHIQPISTNDIEYESKGDRYIPYIKSTGVTTYLDSPAVHLISLSQDPETPYASSWFRSALQSIIASTEFINDLRRSFNKASLPRLDATIDIEKFIETLPPETKYDEEKLTKALNKVIAGVEEQLNGLNPEDAIAHFDLVKIEHLTAGNASNHENVETHAKILNGQMSNGLHILPSLLGRGESQTTASTETVLFLKIVESLQGRLNELYSYLFTLAARLQGQDVTVDFTYKKPSLRPEIEEESFQTMKQSRVFQQLSLGFISDEEASILVTGDLPSGNFTPLSGTMFDVPGLTTSDNPYSNTSVSGDQLNNSKDQKDRQQGDKKPKSNSTSGK